MQTYRAITKLPRIYKPLTARSTLTRFSYPRSHPLVNRTMSNFGLPYHSGFDTLLRLLDTSPEFAPRRHAHPHAKTFTPKFDVREHDTAFELHGELPGIKQEDVDIEFVEENTLVIKGHTEHEFVHSSDADEGDKKAIQAHPSGTSSSYHKATAEDEPSTESAAGADKQVQSQQQPQPSSTEIETRREDPTQYKYWVSERSVGDFQRSFSFPGKVDQDGVRASLKNGILEVTVPKKLKRETAGRKIAVQ